MSRRTFPRVGVAGLAAALLTASTVHAQQPPTPPRGSATVDFSYTPFDVTWSYTTTPRVTVAPMPRPAASPAACCDDGACCPAACCEVTGCGVATACPAPAAPQVTAACPIPAAVAQRVTVIRAAPAMQARLGEFRAVSVLPSAPAAFAYGEETSARGFRPLGTWYKVLPEVVVSVTFGPDGDTLTAKTVSARGEAVAAVTLTADCTMTKDGTVHGVVTGADVDAGGTADLVKQAQELVGQPFAFRLRCDDGGLMVSNLRCGGSGDEAKTTTAALSGTYKHAADGRVPAPKAAQPTAVGGMTLPTPRYLSNVPQYFPPDPVFPLQRELATMEYAVPALGPQPIRLDFAAPVPCPQAACPTAVYPAPVPCPQAGERVGADFAVNVPGNPVLFGAMTLTPRPACPAGVPCETWDIMTGTLGEMLNGPCPTTVRVTEPRQGQFLVGGCVGSACPTPAAVPAGYTVPPMSPPPALPTSTPSEEPKPAAKLTVADVISLAKVGLSDEVILTQIAVTDSTFVLSVADLKALKQAGVSDKVIVCMQTGDDGKTRHLTPERIHGGIMYQTDPSERMKRLLQQSEEVGPVGLASLLALYDFANRR